MTDRYTEIRLKPEPQYNDVFLVPLILIGVGSLLFWLLYMVFSKGLP